jgi:hypothetical protein
MQKPKESIFIGAEIQGLLRDHQFDEILRSDEKAAWKSCVFVRSS